MSSIGWLIENYASPAPLQKGPPSAARNDDVDCATKHTIRRQSLSAALDNTVDARRSFFGGDGIDADHERYLVLAYQAGSNIAAEALVRAHDAFIRKTARSWHKGDDFDDFFQAGRIAFLRAAKRFDPARKVRLLTFAAYDIEYAMREARRSVGSVVSVPRREHRSTGGPCRDAEYDDGTDSVLDWMRRAALSPTETEMVDAIDFRANVLAMRERERAILSLTLDGYSTDEIGERLGISRQRVCQLRDGGWWPMAIERASEPAPGHSAPEPPARCRVCGAHKPAVDFYLRSDSKKRTTECRACASIREKTRQAEHAGRRKARLSLTNTHAR